MGKPKEPGDPSEDDDGGEYIELPGPESELDMPDDLSSTTFQPQPSIPPPSSSSSGLLPSRYRNSSHPEEENIGADDRQEEGRGSALKSSGSLPLSHAAPLKPNYQITVFTMTVGEQFDVFDSNGRWCEAEVRNTHTSPNTFPFLILPLFRLSKSIVQINLLMSHIFTGIDDMTNGLTTFPIVLLSYTLTLIRKVVF